MFFLIPIVIYPQLIDFQSTQNIKLFADFLFCDKDYLRAIEEYEKYLSLVDDDSLRFKVAIGFSLINNQKTALQKLVLIKDTSPYYEQSKIERLKSLYLLKNDLAFFMLADSLKNSVSKYSKEAWQFGNAALLLAIKELPQKEVFLIPFEADDKNTLSNFYDAKKNPSYKNEIFAGILSGIIPGAGKIYTQNYGDGITAFLITGLLSYLAYTNFENDHSTRAWIFTALGGGLYLGNIYGSISSAQIFNAKLNFEFNEGVKFFIEQKNYFTPVYDFCD